MDDVGEAKKKLALIRERLKYQAVAMVCSLGPKECAELLRWAEEASTALERVPYRVDQTVIT